MTQLEQAKEVFETRGFSLRPFHESLIVGESMNPIKRLVGGIGTSGGKTLLTAGKFELMYKYGYLGKDDRVLIFGADKTILRENFVGTFSSFFSEVPASFSWREVTNSKELREAIEDGVQVIIMLPQTIRPRALQLLKSVKWTWFVQDEAHRWYFKNHIQKILNQIKPKYQLLLTGTPFKFNLRKNQFDIHYTSVRTMYELGYLSDVMAQVLHSSVSLNTLVWVGILNNLKQSRNLSKSEIEDTLNEVIKQMTQKLKVPFKKQSSIHNITQNALSVFGKLQKTIIFTHGTKEADVVGKYLTNLGIKNLVSHSKIEGENPNDTFESFKNDSEIKILVAVNRGKEGFDFPELYNVIDMTYTQNFEVVMQIFGRVLRKSPNIPLKYFFKVAPKNLSGFFVEWMDAMFMLFDDECYSTYNGKNGFDIRIPNQVRNKKSKSPKSGKGTSSKGKIKPRNVEFFNSLSFMKDNKWFKIDDKISTVASTTLGEVCIEHGLINKVVNRKVQAYTADQVRKGSKKYNKKVVFQKSEPGLWKAAQRLGIVDEVCAHMDKNTRWTKQSLEEVSRGYNNKTKFIKENKAAYLAARRMGIWEELSKDWPSRSGKSREWNDDYIRECAEGCNSRHDFELKDLTAYQKASPELKMELFGPPLQNQFG